VGTQCDMIQTDRDIPAFVNMALRGDLALDKLVAGKFRVEAMKQRQILKPLGL
jgi:hypothetical protein